MRYYIGIDGGGTKTAYLLIDETGMRRFRLETKGCSYRELGINAVAQLLKKSVDTCLKEAGIPLEHIAGIAAGLPCYGEMQPEDDKLKEAVGKAFDGTPVHIVNDVEAGWAGSLGLKPGINIVAGTGSIAFGKNSQGETARSGGWSTFFGDEGSCYWLGRRTMELFSKQSDGRVKKGPLYQIMTAYFQLKNDLDFISQMDNGYIEDRSRVASLQKLLLEAAGMGDASARLLYQEAAAELAMMVNSIANKLWDGEEIAVSYSGGLFHAQEFVLPGLQQTANLCNGRLLQPEFTPVEGAALLAVQKFSQTNTTLIIEQWKKK